MGVQTQIMDDGLTNEDIRLIDHIAERMIASGGWKRVEYCVSDSAEIVNAYRTERCEPVYSVGRQFGGFYIVDDYETGRASFGASLALTLRQHAGLNADDDRSPRPKTRQF